MNDRKVVTPCVSICRLNEENICIGCGRTKKEIREWMIFSDKRRRSIMLRLGHKPVKQVTNFL